MGTAEKALAGKACLITGASSGLGRSTVRAMAAAGAHVALVARSADDLDQAAEEAASDGRMVTIPADLVDVDMNEHVVQRTVDELGRLDVVINAAATDVPKTVVELSAGEWDRVLAVNLRAPFLLAKHSFPHLRQAGGGTLVNVSYRRTPGMGRGERLLREQVRTHRSHPGTERGGQAPWHPGMCRVSRRDGYPLGRLDA